MMIISLMSRLFTLRFLFGSTTTNHGPILGSWYIYYCSFRTLWWLSRNLMQTYWQLPVITCVCDDPMSEEITYTEATVAK